MKTLQFITLICFLLLGCENDRRTKKTGLVYIEQYEITDTTGVNQTATIEVLASVGNGCWDDLFVDLEKEGVKEYSIRAYGTFSCYEGGCPCPAVMVYHDTIIEFMPDQRGLYLFHIQRYYGNIITDTLVVN